MNHLIALRDGNINGIVPILNQDKNEAMWKMTGYYELLDSYMGLNEINYNGFQRSAKCLKGTLALTKLNRYFYGCLFSFEKLVCIC